MLKMYTSTYDYVCLCMVACVLHVHIHIYFYYCCTHIIGSIPDCLHFYISSRSTIHKELGIFVENTPAISI